MTYALLPLTCVAFGGALYKIPNTKPGVRNAVMLGVLSATMIGNFLSYKAKN